MRSMDAPMYLNPWDFWRGKIFHARNVDLLSNPRNALTAKFTIIGSVMTYGSSKTQVSSMNIHSQQELGRCASHAAVFASLRAKLAGEVSSSAVLADLLEKLNRMQEAQARPGEFKESFDAFIARPVLSGPGAISAFSQGIARRRRASRNRSN
jgi:hypothetical protein